MVVGLVIGLILGLILNTLVLWIVDKLGLGIEISGLGAAFLGALAVAVILLIKNWLWTALNLGDATGVLGIVVSVVVSAAVIYLAAAVVPGFRAKGFVGAMVAAVAIALLEWGAALLLGGMA